ncbi:phosphatidate phosphatase LPIN2 isoform X1 [Electrophorus electricus]|uniref:phosphatidate phosphatase LPIN2 isoform X1 n=1 Tax=Electrophorus electricus TaxID=8005 RepID=UPI0015CFBA6B|nr:phosphatidate phosphatase LPIN2 isoform X1 [Electrophorus electricus]
MNYVGQLAETVFVTVKELYRGLNPATLTGGIDIIVVRQPDGSLQCSPFHVRFGKLGVLRSKEKVVDIEINGKPVDLHMKLGDNGEAFFVEESENLEAGLPAHLCTSPIPIEVPQFSEVTESPSSTTSSSSTRRKKRRRKRARCDAHPREDCSSSSEERETPEQELNKEEPVSPMMASKSVYYSLSEEPSEDLTGTQTKDLHPHSDGECSPTESVFYSRSSSPKSDSELLVKPQETSGPQMQWNWGGFPKVCQTERTGDLPRVPSFLFLPSDHSHSVPSDQSHFRIIQRQASIDMESSTPLEMVTVVRPEPRTFVTEPRLSDNLPRVSHSTPNGTPEASRPKQRASPLRLDQVEPGATDDLRHVSGPQGLNGLIDCTVNTISTCSTDGSARIANPLNSANGNIAPAVSVITVVSDSPDHQRNQTDAVGTGRPETLATSVDLIGKTTPQSAAGKAALTEKDSGIEAFSEGLAEVEEWADTHTQQDNKDAETQPMKVMQLVESPGSSQSPSKAAELQERKKGKRSQHLGPADIYLDDLSSLNPEAVALYFPRSDGESAVQSGAELSSIQLPRTSPQSSQMSPQPLSTGNVDSGTEYLSDSTTDTLDISLSLCGTKDHTRQINKEKFMEHIVKYQDLVNNPGIIDDPNLVICINSNYYNWAVAAPMILSMQAFQKNLPKSTVEQLVTVKMPKKSARWWFSWRRKDMDNNQPSSKPGSDENHLEASSSPPVSPSLKDYSSQLSSDDDVTDSKKQKSGAEAMSTSQCMSQVYRKSLRLTSQQIECLNLREGANAIVFSVTTQYQGTCRCEAAIYLWNWNDKVIISDIDGTITKSDALGHILPQLGKDWTHQGIAKLYHRIHQNGYKFLYCSARAIGMADITKGYLQWVNEKGIVLPKGPVLLAPSSLFSALHREVIEKKPEVFKITCLNDIRELFSPYQQPFYAAFGNRTNDVFAYKKVRVPETRIFTVNPKGELIQEKSKSYKSSYNHLSEMVEHIFPLLSKGQTTAFDHPEFSHFSYWREPLSPLDLSLL